METQHSTRKLTYDDYLQFPDDLLRHEIIDGEHYVTPSPMTRHQRISGRLFHLLQAHLENHPGGEVFFAPLDVLLSRFDIVVPDLVYISHERARFLTEKNLQGPPDLAVEILSPATKARDQHLKRDLYERVGVREYWLVDPKRNEVTLYHAGPTGFEPPKLLTRAAGDVLTTDLLPELRVPLERLLA